MANGNMPSDGFFDRPSFLPPRGPSSVGTTLVQAVREQFARPEKSTGDQELISETIDGEESENTTGKPSTSIAEAHIVALLKRNQEERDRILRESRMEKRRRIDMEQKQKEQSIRMQGRYIHERYHHTKNKIERVRTCIRCRKSYTMQESMGRWQCRYHPSSLDGKCMYCKQEGAGCTPCDHTEYSPVYDGILFYRLDSMVFQLLDHSVPIQPRALSTVKVRDDDPLPLELALGPIYDLISKKDRSFEESQQLQQLADDRDLAERQALLVPRAKVQPKGLRVENASMRVEEGEDEECTTTVPVVTKRNVSSRGVLEQLARTYFYIQTASHADAGTIDYFDIRGPVH